MASLVMWLNVNSSFLLSFIPNTSQDTILENSAKPAQYTVLLGPELIARKLTPCTFKDVQPATCAQFRKNKLHKPQMMDSSVSQYFA